MAGETIIQALQTYMTTCPLFEESGLKPSVNWLDYEPNSYGIFALPGEKTIVAYPVGGGMYEFPFELLVNASNADDLARLQTQGFFEKFSHWLEEQGNNDILPILSNNQVAFDIEALGQGYLVEQGESNVSTYGVPCKLIYEKKR
jgi:hypothetical protein